MMVKRYRKKPVEVEVILFDGKNQREVTEFANGAVYDPKSGKVVIPTLEGDVTADVGDYVIKGVHGEFYPCKPDIFRETYEPVNNTRITRRYEN